MEERFREIERKVRRKEMKKNLLVLLISLVVVIIIIELILRISGVPVYGFQEGVFVADEDMGYLLSKNYIGTQSVYGKNYLLKTNDKGLRDSRNYEYLKPQNTTRILILGDSISFGNGVNLEESFSEILREKYKLNSELNVKKDIEIINMGVPGYGINNEYLIFINEGKKYDPDIVLLQYTTNDWYTHQLKEENGEIILDKEYSTTANKDGVLVSYNEKPRLRNIHVFFLLKSRSYSFIYSKSRSLLDGLVNKYWGSRGVPLYFRDKNSEVYREAYDGYGEVLELLKNEVDGELILFIGPFKEDLVSEKDIQDYYGINYRIDPRQTQESVIEIAKELNLSTIVLESRDKSIFIPVDGHWNLKGNELVADKIHRELESIVYS